MVVMNMWLYSSQIGYSGGGGGGYSPNVHTGVEVSHESAEKQEKKTCLCRSS